MIFSSIYTGTFPAPKIKYGLELFLTAEIKNLLPVTMFRSHKSNNLIISSLLKISNGAIFTTPFGILFSVRLFLTNFTSSLEVWYDLGLGHNIIAFLDFIELSL